MSLSAPAVAAPLLRGNGELYVATADGYVHSFGGSLEHRFSFSLEGLPVGVVEVGEGVLLATSARQFTSIHSRGAERYHFRSFARPQFGLGLDELFNLYYVGADRFVYSVTSRGVARFRVEMPSEPVGAPLVVGSDEVWVPLRDGLARLNSARAPDIVKLPHAPDRARVALGRLWFSDATRLFRVEGRNKTEGYTDVVAWDGDSELLVVAQLAQVRVVERSGAVHGFEFSHEARDVFVGEGDVLLASGPSLSRVNLEGQLLREYTLPGEVLEARRRDGVTFVLTRDGRICAWSD